VSGYSLNEGDGVRGVIGMPRLPKKDSLFAPEVKTGEVLLFSPLSFDSAASSTEDSKNKKKEKKN